MISSVIARLSDIGYRYGSHQALDGVDLSLDRGKVTALLGPNGAGKSTLIHLLLGLLTAQLGSVELFGKSPQARGSKERVGAMLQISGVQDNLSVLELIHLFGSLYPCPADPGRLVEEAGLTGLEHRRFGKLSGGQKQRLFFALALIGNPDLLILDEPTTGLDPAARQRLWRAIEQRRSQGASILLCTHDMDEAARLADRVVVLHRGRVLIEGSPAEIRSHVPSSVIHAQSSLSLNRIRSLDQASSVEKNEDRYRVLSNDPIATLRAWLAADPELQGLEVAGADLETAFLTLIEDDQAPSEEAA